MPNRRPRLGLWLPILLVMAAAQGSAQDWPRVTEVRFSGNRITQEKVMLREMSLGPGDRADPAAIEGSRQAILDLGLFRDVAIRTEPHDEGVALLVEVREKRYFLPVPRVDTSSDGDFSYGAQVRWSNVFGLNHRLNAFVEEGDFPEDRRRESERTLRLSYTAPFIGDTRQELYADLEKLDRVVPSPQGGYEEEFRRLELRLDRDFTRGRPRQGWTLGGGLFFEDHDTAGAAAPPADGRTTALVGVADYSDLRFHVHSETGREFAARMELAADGVGSDYGYRHLTARWFDSRTIGSREHQTLHLLAAAGVRDASGRLRDSFSLGGSGRLRGYESDFLQGDRYYYGAVEYLRPLRWNWLRLLVTAEAGGAERDRAGTTDASPYASLGVGVRVRVTWFVDVEIEAGLAVPLRGGDGVRFFAGGN
ncbi:MAG TPA: POTRA domain-containing protein [Xanthomonadaceae bacterium]|nr:POTRA domain-containing protein [Xanthomonadaceae bacterium]